jgi:hypothetical protein
MDGGEERIYFEYASQRRGLLMSGAGRRYLNCRDRNLQALQDEEGNEGGRGRNECRTEMRSSDADVEGRV